jgi:hypothetical protein
VTLPPRETWPALRNTLKAKRMLAGICGTCKPPRHVVVPIGPLIERFGCLPAGRLLDGVAWRAAQGLEGPPRCSR